jgi:hypothetical protein
MLSNSGVQGYNPSATRIITPVSCFALVFFSAKIRTGFVFAVGERDFFPSPVEPLGATTRNKGFSRYGQARLLMAVKVLFLSISEI